VNLADKVVLELGSGTGCLGLWVKKQYPTATVVMTDVERSVHIIRKNIALNGYSDGAQVWIEGNKYGGVYASELYFGADVSTALPPVLDGRLDCILVSDCLFTNMAAPHYWTELADTLGGALARPAWTQHLEVWFILQERFGSRDISPFLQALRLSFIKYGGGGGVGGGGGGGRSRRLVQEEVLHPSIHDYGYTGKCATIGGGKAWGSWVEAEASIHSYPFPKRLFRFSTEAEE
jgi:hypothetical protein